MKTEIVVSLFGAIKRSSNREPDECAYFTEVFGFPRNALPVPAGWQQDGGFQGDAPHNKRVTISLPDFISEDDVWKWELHSAYRTGDGFGDRVIITCDAIRVCGNVEAAIDVVIKTIVVSAPTKSGKRENIPFTIEAVSPIW